MAKKSGLGAGINALIPDLPVVEPEQRPVDELDIHKVEPNRDQPRKQFDQEKLEALSSSIKEHGVVQPLIVTKKDDYYQIVAGERRWRAAKMAGLRKVPVVIRDYDEIQVEQIALVENLQREDLNPVEEAAGYQQLMDRYGLTQEEVSQKIGKSRPAVANSLRLLSLPKEIQKMLMEDKLSAGHARALLSMEDSSKMLSLAKETAEKSLSVRQVESLAKKKTAVSSTSQRKSAVSRDVANAIAQTNEKLEHKFGTKVNISYSNQFKGKVELSFSNYKQMNDLLDQLCGGKDGQES